MEENKEEYELRLKRYNSEKKKSRYGVLIFLLIHFIFEIFTGNSKGAGPLIIANFYISMWYIKYKLQKKINYNNLLLFGLFVASIVFLIRLLLGIIVFYFITK